MLINFRQAVHVHFDLKTSMVGDNGEYFNVMFRTARARFLQNENDVTFTASLDGMVTTCRIATS